MMFVVERVSHVHGRSLGIWACFPPLHAAVTCRNMERISHIYFAWEEDRMCIYHSIRHSMSYSASLLHTGLAVADDTKGHERSQVLM